MVNDLNVDRIDHGNQAIRDNELVNHIVENDIPMTLCPVSNVSINVYESIAEHPIIELRNRGATVTVNSDDPPFFQTDLNTNFTQLAETFNLGVDDIIQLVRNSFSCSYATEEEKTAYLAGLDDWCRE